MLARVFGACVYAVVRLYACVGALGHRCVRSNALLHAMQGQCPFLWLVRYGFLMLACVAGACACADVEQNAFKGAHGHARVRSSAKLRASSCGCQPATRSSMHRVHYGFVMLERVAGACACANVRLNTCRVRVLRVHARVLCAVERMQA
jgi:hypothetical protein